MLVVGQVYPLSATSFSYAVDWIPAGVLREFDREEFSEAVLIAYANYAYAFATMSIAECFAMNSTRS